MMNCGLIINLSNIFFTLKNIYCEKFSFSPSFLLEADLTWKHKNLPNFSLTRADTGTDQPKPKHPKVVLFCTLQTK